MEKVLGAVLGAELGAQKGTLVPSTGVRSRGYNPVARNPGTI